MTKEVQFDLPWPVSVNRMYYNTPKNVPIGKKNYYVNSKGQVVEKKRRGRTLTPEARQYKKLAAQIVYYSTLGVKFGSSRVSMKVIYFHPHGKENDRDNGLKIVLDSIQLSGLIENDNQIREYHVIEGQPSKDGLWKIWMKPCSKDIKFAKFEEYLDTLVLEE